MTEPVKTRKDIVVYTCIVNGYDELIEPEYTDPEIDYYCIGDISPPPGSKWMPLPIHTRFNDPAVANRYVKMHPHVYFPEYEISVYVDGNIKLVSSPRAIALEAMSEASIALYQHFSRMCIYAEAEECASLGHDWLWRIYRQMNRYRQENYPVENGLYEGNVIIRRHNSPEIISLMNLWWHEYLSGVKRDQISLPFLLWKTFTAVYNLGASDQRNERKVFSLGIVHQRALSTRMRGVANRLILGLRSFFFS